MQPIGTTRNAVLSVLTPTVPYNGQTYSLPLSIVANKSTQDPNAPVNCTWSPATGACSTSACSTPGTQTISWTKSVTESHGGTCPAAPASSTVACNTNHPCQTITTAFTNIGTTSWTVPAGVTSVWVLVVGGGGGGGEAGYNNPGVWHAAGGGGGGGVIENRQYSVSPGSYITVTVGAGGSGDGTLSPEGGNSVFGTLTATGGGRGAGWATYPASNDMRAGGSGGGGDGYYIPPVTTTTPAGQGVAGQGYAGGTGGVYAAPGQPMSTPYNFYCCGGGGGGAGGPGGNSSGTLAYPSVGKGGDGGPGVTSSIWGQTITVGAGGGGGAGSTQNYQGCLAKNGCVITPGRGGSNVGGMGGGPTQMNGANAGGWGCGGGGGTGVAQPALGGAGSQGIVIIQYQG